MPSWISSRAGIGLGIKLDGWIFLDLYIYIYIVGIRFVLFLGCLECSLNGFVVMCVRVVALFSSAIDSLLFFGLSRRIEYCGALWEKW